jgi:hypothetical protein
MKKVIITNLAAVSVLISSSFAQTLISGWDFSQFQFDGSSDLTGDFVGEPSINSNFGLNSGTLYWDGSFGTTAIDFVADDIFGANGAQQSGNLTTPGLSPNFNNSGFGTRFNTNTNSEEFVFQLNTSTFADISITFDAITNNGSSDLQFAYSIDGGSSYITASSLNINDISSVGFLDLSSIDAVENVSNLFVKGTISGLNGAETLSLDNIQVLSSNAVPEPSTYALIFGVITIGFVIHHRRK